MASEVLSRITTELTEVGYTLTSYSELGLPFDETLIARLCESVDQDTFGAKAATLTQHIEKQNMIIAQGETTLAFGTEFVRPVVEKLFAESPRALGRWSLYAMNRYNDGGSFGAHKDSVGATVLVITATGRRTMDVYQREEDPQSFVTVEATLDLTPGSIMIIDGQLDPGHSVRCIEGPSISAVLDVPELLRP